MVSNSYTAKRRDFTKKEDSIIVTLIKAGILAAAGYVIAWVFYLAA